MCSPLNVCKLCCQAQSLHCNYFFLPLYSSETVNLARPFARRAANTRRPFFVAILSRKPCLFFLFLLEGWNVLFIVLYILYCLYSLFRLFAFQLAKLLFFFILAKFSRGIFSHFYIIAAIASSAAWCRLLRMCRSGLVWQWSCVYFL